MADTILRNSSRILYHNHIEHFRNTPFIFHKDLVCDKLPCQLNVHESIEYLFVIEGKGQLEIDEKRLDLKMGDIAIINSYVAHRVLCDDSIRYYCLIVEKSFYKENNIDFSHLFFTPVIHDQIASNYFSIIADEYYCDMKFKRAGFRAAILNLIVYLCRNYRTQHTTNKEHAQNQNFHSIQLAIIYIKNNLQKQLTLEEVARQAQISKYHFSRIFKDVTGYTVFSYINNLRCEHAKILLSGGKISIQEVAVLCGFKNISYFTKTFKTYTSFTPSEFIKISDPQ